MTGLIGKILCVCLCWLLFYQALIKSPFQDRKLPSYLRDLSISTDKVAHEVNSSPGTLGAVINILDLLSTIPIQVNSEMMTVSLFMPCRSLGSHLFTPQDLWSRNNVSSLQLLLCLFQNNALDMSHITCFASSGFQYVRECCQYSFQDLKKIYLVNLFQFLQ